MRGKLLCILVLVACIARTSYASRNVKSKLYSLATRESKSKSFNVDFHVDAALKGKDKSGVVRSQVGKRSQEMENSKRRLADLDRLLGINVKKITSLPTLVEEESPTWSSILVGKPEYRRTMHVPALVYGMGFVERIVYGNFSRIASVKITHGLWGRNDFMGFVLDVKFLIFLDGLSKAATFGSSPISRMPVQSRKNQFSKEIYCDFDRFRAEFPLIKHGLAIFIENDDHLTISTVGNPPLVGIVLRDSELGLKVLAQGEKNTCVSTRISNNDIVIVADKSFMQVFVEDIKFGNLYEMAKKLYAQIIPIRGSVFISRIGSLNSTKPESKLEDPQKSQEEEGVRKASQEKEILKEKQDKVQKESLVESQDQEGAHEPQIIQEFHESAQEPQQQLQEKGQEARKEGLVIDGRISESSENSDIYKLSEADSFQDFLNGNYDTSLDREYNSDKEVSLDNISNVEIESGAGSGSETETQSDEEALNSEAEDEDEKNVSINNNTTLLQDALEQPGNRINGHDDLTREPFPSLVPTIGSDTPDDETLNNHQVLRPRVDDEGESDYESITYSSESSPSPKRVERNAEPPASPSFIAPQYFPKSKYKRSDWFGNEVNQFYCEASRTPQKFSGLYFGTRYFMGIGGWAKVEESKVHIKGHLLRAGFELDHTLLLFLDGFSKYKDSICLSTALVKKNYSGESLLHQGKRSDPYYATAESLRRILPLWKDGMVVSIEQEELIMRSFGTPPIKAAILRVTKKGGDYVKFAQSEDDILVKVPIIEGDVVIIGDYQVVSEGFFFSSKKSLKSAAFELERRAGIRKSITFLAQIKRKSY